MPSIGDWLLNMTGRADPRAALAQAIAGGGGATPGSTPPAQGTGGAAAAPAPIPSESEIYKSPNELMNLYIQLQDRQARSAQIDRGIGLMGASLAHPENRAGILRTFSGEAGGGNNPSAMINSLIDFQTKSAALSQKAAQRNTIPSIAEKYGLDTTTALYLFDTGKLDSVIAELEKPDKQLVQGADKRHYIVDKSTGEVSAPLGPEAQREIVVEPGPNGSRVAVYADTKEPVAGREPLVPAEGNTDFEKNYQNALRDEPGLTREAYRARTNTQKTVTYVDGAGNALPEPPPGTAYAIGEDGKVKTVDGVPQTVIIPNSPAAREAEKARLEAEEAKTSTDKKSEQKTVQGGIVSQDIDRAIDVVDKHKDSWVGVTGWGSLLSKLPATDARFLEQTLNTVKANVGFDKLQAMRDSSPTGAALGPVSDFENQLLQATSGALDQGGDPEVLKFNLRRIQKIFQVIGQTKITPENVGVILGDVGGAGFTPGPELSEEDQLLEDLKKYGISK